MDRTVAARQVGVETVGIEGRYRSDQHGYSGQTAVKGLIGREFVCVHLLAPETFAVEAHIPVREVVVDKVAYRSGRFGRFVIVKSLFDSLYQSVERRENPSVDFRTFGDGYLSRFRIEAIDIGVKGEERVCVVERREELTGYFAHARRIEFQVVPGRGV